MQRMGAMVWCSWERRWWTGAGVEVKWMTTVVVRSERTLAEANNTLSTRIALIYFWLPLQLIFRAGQREVCHVWFGWDGMRFSLLRECEWGVRRREEVHYYYEDGCE